MSCEACCYFQGNKRGRGVHNRPRHRALHEEKINTLAGFAFTTTIFGGKGHTGNRRPVGVRFRGALSRGIRFRSELVHINYGGAEDRKSDFRGSFGGEFGGLGFKGFSVILRFGFVSIVNSSTERFKPHEGAGSARCPVAVSSEPRIPQDPKTPPQGTRRAAERAEPIPRTPGNSLRYWGVIG